MKIRARRLHGVGGFQRRLPNRLGRAVPGRGTTLNRPIVLIRNVETTGYRTPLSRQTAQERPDRHSRKADRRVGTSSSPSPAAITSAKSASGSGLTERSPSIDQRMTLVRSSARTGMPANLSIVRTFVKSIRREPKMPGHRILRPASPFRGDRSDAGRELLLQLLLGARRFAYIVVLGIEELMGGHEAGFTSHMWYWECEGYRSRSACGFESGPPLWRGSPAPVCSSQEFINDYRTVSGQATRWEEQSGTRHSACVADGPPSVDLSSLPRRRVPSGRGRRSHRLVEDP